MILYSLCGDTEDHPVYKRMAVENGGRQYDFLRSLVSADLALGRESFLSAQIIKALNYHAIACLHTNAGEYRPCEVSVGKHSPPLAFLVESYMEDFINTVNRVWMNTDPVGLASFVLWRLNHIHPFINGNGRTARACAYFVLCLRIGSWLPGEKILPELIKRERDRYVVALQQVDQSFKDGKLDLGPLHSLLWELIQEQVGITADSAQAAAATPMVDGDSPSPA